MARNCNVANVDDDFYFTFYQREIFRPMNYKYKIWQKKEEGKIEEKTYQKYVRPDSTTRTVIHK